MGWAPPGRQEARIGVQGGRKRGEAGLWGRKCRRWCERLRPWIGPKDEAVSTPLRCGDYMLPGPNPKRGARLLTELRRSSEGVAAARRIVGSLGVGWVGVGVHRLCTWRVAAADKLSPDCCNVSTCVGLRHCCLHLQSEAWVVSRPHWLANCRTKMSFTRLAGHHKFDIRDGVDAPSLLLAWPRRVSLKWRPYSHSASWMALRRNRSCAQ